jgi:hypothetical protein
VGRDLLGWDRRAVLACRRGVFRKALLERVAGELLALAGRE